MIDPDPTAIRLVTDSRAKLHNADVIADDGAGPMPLAALVFECTGPGGETAHALGFWLPLETVADLVAKLQLVLAKAVR
jgi:hypothetical protein